MTKTSISDSKIQANRQNAQLSTGPVTEAGKAASSRSNFRHGLAGAFCVLPGESVEDFERLRTDLEEEHGPATTTESLLVDDMARHYWLYQRALRLQEECFACDFEAASTQARFSLLLRYGITHEPAFRRCLADLAKLRKDRLQLQRGFESQARGWAAERRREVAAQCRSLTRNGRGQTGNWAETKEVNDILEGFEALDEYFRTADEEPRPSKRKGKGDRKAA
ncbi:MAG: hypothetical protein ACJ746_23870 [Bryobacteraceae bacterium]